MESAHQTTFKQLELLTGTMRANNYHGANPLQFLTLTAQFASFVIELSKNAVEKDSMTIVNGITKHQRLFDQDSPCLTIYHYYS